MKKIISALISLSALVATSTSAIVFNPDPVAGTWQCEHAAFQYSPAGPFEMIAYSTGSNTYHFIPETIHGRTPMEIAPGGQVPDVNGDLSGNELNFTVSNLTIDSSSGTATASATITKTYLSMMREIRFTMDGSFNYTTNSIVETPETINGTTINQVSTQATPSSVSFTCSRTVMVPRTL